MKTLTALFLISLAVVAAAQTHVQFDLRDPSFGITQTTGRTVIVQSETKSSSSGSVVLLPYTLRGVTGTNGSVTFSNLSGSSISGFYHVTIPAPPLRSDFDIWVNSTNLGLISASSIRGVFGATTYPSSSFAWAADVSDVRYLSSTNSISGSGTPLRAGTGINVATEGGTNVASVDSTVLTNGASVKTLDALQLTYDGDTIFDGQGVFYSFGVESLDTRNRRLTDSSTNATLDWQNRQLLGGWDLGAITNTFASLTAVAATNAATMASITTLSNVVAATNGVLLDGVLYPTLEAAANFQRPRSVLRILGTISMTNKVTITNVTVDATGALLLNYSTNSIGIPLPFILYDNCIWQGGTISNMIPSVAQGIFGYDTANGDPVCTNMTVRNVRCLGATDANFFSHSIGGGGGLFENCEFITGYDTLVSKSVGSQWVYRNCTFICDGSWTGGVAFARDIIQNGSHLFINCRFVKPQMPFGISSGTFIQNGGTSNTESMTNTFIGCRWFGNSTNAAAANLVTAGGGSARTNLSQFINCTLDGVGPLTGFSFATKGNNLISGCTILPNDTTNTQFSLASANATLQVSGGNITSSRATVTSGTLSWGGDIGHSNAFVPNAYVSNLNATVYSGLVNTNNASTLSSGTVDPARLPLVENVALQFHADNVTFPAGISSTTSFFTVAGLGVEARLRYPMQAGYVTNVVFALHSAGSPIGMGTNLTLWLYTNGVVAAPNWCQVIGTNLGSGAQYVSTSGSSNFYFPGGTNLISIGVSNSTGSATPNLQYPSVKVGLLK